MNIVKTERNYGIDLLRLLSMFYVIVLHTLGHGGILATAAENSMQYFCAWGLEIWVYVAVDIMAIISGYVLSTKGGIQGVVKRYIKIWIEVVFYALIISAVMIIAYPNQYTLSDLLKSFFPVINNNYWYFTAYTGATFFIPIIICIVKKISEKGLIKVLIIVLLLFSLADSIIKRFIPNDGYSFIWIALLFLVGAIIRKTDFCKKVKTKYLLIVIALFAIITWIWKIWGVSFNIFQITVKKDFLVSYTSPTILIASILYVIMMSKIKVGSIGCFVAKWFASNAFAAYLINDNRLFRSQFITDKFSFLANDNTVKMILSVIGFSVLFLVLSLLIDKIRQYLFQIAKVDKLSNNIAIYIAKCINFISERFLIL